MQKSSARDVNIESTTPLISPIALVNKIPMTPEVEATVLSGREVELDMAPATVRVEGKETITWVMFGEEGAGALLGAYTLEGVFLAVDPYNQRLTPVHGVLK